MKELRTTLTFLRRCDSAVLQETLSYFVPDCGDMWTFEQSSLGHIHTVNVYSRRFLPKDNRVELYCNVVTIEPKD